MQQGDAGTTAESERVDSGISRLVENCFRHKNKQDQQNDIEDNLSVNLNEHSTKCAKLTERKQVIIIFNFLSLGWLMLTISMMFPEWVMVRKNQGLVEDHVGFFQTCTYNRVMRTVSCSYAIIAELGGPISMIFSSFLLGLSAVIFGIRYLAYFRGTANDKGQSKIYSLIRALSFASGIVSLCGMASITYLYNQFLSSKILTSYALGWVASFLIMVGGVLGYCFQVQNFTPESSIAPIPMQTSRVSWQEQSTACELTSSDKAEGSSDPTILVNTASH